jgi:formiminotetrahydrofolate cyclodeaminase
MIQTGSGVREETVEGFVHRLAERAPTPGGGAVAALGAAHAAALVGMAARFTTGPRYAAVANLAEEVATAADQLREQALDLADRDQQVFTAVAQAYQLAKDTESDRSRRSAAIRDALAEAALPPAALVGVARELVGLAERLRPVANPSVAGEIAAAAATTYAAASTARVNVEANLRGLPEGDRRRALLHEISDVEQLLDRALQVGQSVREELLA